MKYLAYIFPVAVLAFLIVFSLGNDSTADNPATNKQQETMSKSKTLDSDKSKLSYALGSQIAKSIKMQSESMDIDLSFVQQAIFDTLSNKSVLMTEEEVKTELVKWQQAEIAARKSDAEANKVKGDKFLEDNKSKEGVKVTESGLQYQIIELGAGEFPTATSTVKVNYKGSLINGEEFDSSFKRGEPITFRLDQVVKGWSEGLQLVKPGGKIKLFIPAELGYGEQGRPSIPANSVLVFEVDLIEIVK